MKSSVETKHVARLGNRSPPLRTDLMNGSNQVTSLRCNGPTQTSPNNTPTANNSKWNIYALIRDLSRFINGKRTSLKTPLRTWAAFCERVICFLTPADEDPLPVLETSQPICRQTSGAAAEARSPVFLILPRVSQVNDLKKKKGFFDSADWLVEKNSKILIDSFRDLRSSLPIPLHRHPISGNAFPFSPLAYMLDCPSFSSGRLDPKMTQHDGWYDVLSSVAPSLKVQASVCRTDVWTSWQTLDIQKAAVS